MNFRLTAAMLGVLVVLAGVVWFTEFRDKGSAEATTPAKPDLEVLKFEVKDTRSIEVVKPDQRVLLEQNEQGDWVIQPSGLPGERFRITSPLSRLSTLQATRKVADAPEDLEQYGLAIPSLTVTVTQTDGASYVLQAGAKPPTGASTYIKRADDPTVFLVANQLIGDLERLVNEPPIQQPTPTAAPIPSPASPVPSPEATATPTG